MQSEFLLYLSVEKHYSEHTVAAYAKDLEQFQEHLHSYGPELDITSAEAQWVRNWVVDLMDKGLSVRTVQRKISTLRSFYRYLKRNGYRVDNPVATLHTPKAPSRLPQFVEQEGMRSLFWDADLFPDDFSGLRDRCLMLLLYSTGIRLSELIGIQEADFSQDEIKVIGKRNKERLVPIARELKKTMEDYLEAKHSTIGATDHLLVLDNGQKLYPKFVYRRVNQYLGSVTTLSKKSPHVLRHTFATHMLENGAELQSIKEILGHANLAATQVYTHNSIDRLKKIHTKSHPRG
ncbi:MAG: tyrosine-type recombinase/integrase [Flavobacteriales bacterium]|nr:tyrosine-type recombinase/integrase [Flavobacteriales bacterium]